LPHGSVLPCEGKKKHASFAIGLLDWEL